VVCPATGSSVASGKPPRAVFILSAPRWRGPHRSAPRLCRPCSRRGS
jgi:hypothetical protein